MDLDGGWLLLIDWVGHPTHPLDPEWYLEAAGDLGHGTTGPSRSSVPLPPTALCSPAAGDTSPERPSPSERVAEKGHRRASPMSSPSTPAILLDIASGRRRADQPPLSFHIQGRPSAWLSYETGSGSSAVSATLSSRPARRGARHHETFWAPSSATRLTLVLAEAALLWLLNFLSRMDMEWVNLRDKIDYAPSVAPSELFRRQVMATFEEEVLAHQFVPHLGADSCMWAADYPHTDSTFPESQRSIEETLGMLPAEDRRKITALNCAKLYGFEYVA